MTQSADTRYCAKSLAVRLQESLPAQRSVYTTYVGSTLTDKVKVVVLGSGWAAMSLVKALSKDTRSVLLPLRGHQGCTYKRAMLRLQLTAVPKLPAKRIFTGSAAS